jgi:hypothetical protein
MIDNLFWWVGLVGTLFMPVGVGLVWHGLWLRKERR